MNKSESVTMETSPSLAEVKLSYKSKVPAETLPEVTSPEQAAGVLYQLWDDDYIEFKEQFVVLLLNNAKRCIGWSRISTGGTTATIVDPGTVFQVALLGNAVSVIVAHNHPSGNLQPSGSDRKLTERIKKSGELLGITLEDHIIITADGYMSFRSKGIL